MPAVQSGTVGLVSAANLLERVRKLLAKAEDPGVTAQEAELYNAKPRS